MSDEKPGCLGFILQALGLLPKNLFDESLPYATRDDFLSPSELSFYKVLQQVVGTRAIICPKVALRDLFFVKTRNRSEYSIYSNKINLKHVDFLLCTMDSLEPICGIELDDSSHKRDDRVVRDAFVDRVFETAGLKLIRFDNKRSYTLSEIDSKISLVLNPGSVEDVPASEINETEKGTDGITEVTSAGVPICKKCGVPMVLRQAKRGENKGQTFYGCPNFPRCRELIKLENTSHY